MRVNISSVLDESRLYAAIGATQSQCLSLRMDAQGRVFMLPQSIIDESVKAFSVSATSPDGYSSLGAPSKRYIAPADSLPSRRRRTSCVFQPT